MVDNQVSQDEELQACVGLVGDGSANAISGLSMMVGQAIAVTSLSARRIPVKDAADLFGGADALAVGIYLSVSGAADGHMFLIYPPQTALALVDLLMGEPAGTTQSLDEMEASALGEMGNIMGSFFLNSLSDAAGLQLLPSPPAVIMDMAGAILDIALAEIMQESDEAIVVETNFVSGDLQLHGTFLVMPSPNLLKQLLARLGA